MDPQRIILQAISKMPAAVIRWMAGTPIIGRGTALDPLMQFLWKAGKKQPAVDSMTPAEARASLEVAAKTLQADVPQSVTAQDDAIPGITSPIPIRIYTPRIDGANPPVTIFFHFGGLVIGSRNICHGFCGLLAERSRTIVVNVEYRLAPEHPFPAAAEDAFAAYRWVVANGAALGADGTRVAVAGDSAGGQLAALICQEAKRSGWQSPRCQVLIYPWLAPYSDLPSYHDFADAYPLTANIMKWFGGHYFRSEQEKEHPWAAPLNENDLGGLPEALIFTAGFDPLRDEGELYASRLGQAGGRVHFRCFEHLTHAFTMLGGVVPAAQRSMIEIADALALRIH